jgi:hypothetical protein
MGHPNRFWGEMQMKKMRCPFSTILILVLVVLIPACQPQVVEVPPTSTPFPSWTPTPTPGPEQMGVVELISRCEELSITQRQVILEGMLFLPSDTIYGYTIDGELWLGINLVKGNRITVLVKVGEGAAAMNPLPERFTEKDLIIHTSDDRIVLDRHRVRITGRPNYKSDDPDRRCELFVDDIYTLEKPEVLVPLEITIEELLNNDHINDCSDLEAENQLVQLKGQVLINTDTTCWNGRCRTPFQDGSGKTEVEISTGGGGNTISPMPIPYQSTDLHVYDSQGMEIDSGNVVLIGAVSGLEGICRVTVYTILPAGP